MRSTAAWIAGAAVCIGVAMMPASVFDPELWIRLTALAVGFFAAGFAIGLRALWGAVAVAGVLLLAVWIARPDDYDMDVRAIETIIALFVLAVSAAAVGIGAFARWVLARATSRRASD